MAALSLLQSNYTDPDAQLESDIADQHHQLNNGQDEVDLPPRPTSRLGFNNSSVAPAVPPAAPRRSRPGTLKWTKSLFQKIGIASHASAASPDVDMDISRAAFANMCARISEEHPYGVLVLRPGDLSHDEAIARELASRVWTTGVKLLTVRGELPARPGASEAAGPLQSNDFSPA